MIFNRRGREGDEGGRMGSLTFLAALVNIKELHSARKKFLVNQQRGAITCSLSVRC